MTPTVHILAYNNVSFTLRTLEEYRPADIIVWDNGSSRENLARLREEPETVMSLDVDQSWHRNRKIGGALNAQLEYGIHRGDEWIVQSDNDTYLNRGWWERMQEYIAVFPEVKLWGFYLCGNHRVVGTEERDGLTIRFPSLLSGTVNLVNIEAVLRYSIRWPEEPVDYSEHRYFHDMGGFDGVDVEFQTRFVNAGFKVALPQEDFAVHMEQPGRWGEYL